MKNARTTLAATALALAAGSTLAALSTPGQAVAVASSSPPQTVEVKIYALAKGLWSSGDSVIVNYVEYKCSSGTARVYVNLTQGNASGSGSWPVTRCDGQWHSVQVTVTRMSPSPFVTGQDGLAVPSIRGSEDLFAGTRGPSKSIPINKI